MISLFRRLLPGIMIAAAGLSAAADEAPIIEFKTQLYEINGAANAFSFRIGAKQNTFLDMDCGFGSTEIEVEDAYFDQDSEEIQATVVTGSVSSEGIVRIYGDPTYIDYLDFEGLYITDLSFPAMTNVEILNLSHNQLKGLDLSHMKKLQALYIDGNPFSESPLVVGADKPDLTIVAMNVIDNLDPAFNISDYPKLASFESYHNPSLTWCDPTGCPELLRLSLDLTNISSIDVTKNPKLLILNVSNTRVTELDLSKNPYLTELYCSHDGAYNNQYRFKAIDFSHNPELQRISVSDNDITSLDISNLSKLLDLSCHHNKLTSLNIDSNPKLTSLNIAYNNMNFVSLPANRNTFSEYYYMQNPFPVDQCQKVGTVLDFSDKVNRPGSVTDAVLYAVNLENPVEGTLLEDDYYKWENGKMTLLKECRDSVYVAFKNNALPDYVLTSSLFMVKTEEDYGKPSLMASLSFSGSVKNPALKVGVEGATEANPRKFCVDFGDGNLVEFTATTSGIPAQANATGTRKGSVKVYMPEGEIMTALGVENQRMLSVDLKNAVALRELAIKGCNLASIDLQWNGALRSLDLSGNVLAKIDMSGANGRFTKNMLTHVNLSDNSIDEFNTDNASVYEDLDISNNKLTEAPTSKASAMRRLDISGNMIETISLQDCEALEELDASGNNISELTIQDYVPLKKLNVSGNKFTFASLPAVGRVASYTYAPQQDVFVPAKSPVVSLHDYMFTDPAGAVTAFEWRMASDNAVVAPGNIRNEDGRFFFDNPDLGVIYCAMTHPAFPDFAGDNVLRTVNVQTAPMPTNIFATFTPSATGSGSITLTGAANGTTVYIDWNGKGEFEQCILKDTYQTFEGNVWEGETAKCYSYDEESGVTVFSIDMPLSAIDASPMKGLVAFCTYNSGLAADNLKLPVASDLQELVINDCEISEVVDIIKDFPNIKCLNLSGNKIVEGDFSAMPELEMLYLSNNMIENLKLDNPKLWELAAVGNKLTSIDLSKVPAMRQLWLSGNNLSSLDLSALMELRSLDVSGNKLMFNTLPPIKSTYIVYYYANQQPVEIELKDNRVDLSSQATVGVVPTEYTWYIDTPYYDENDDLVGEELVEGTEYTIDNGVTEFLANNRHIMCVMTNTNFPDLLLYTTFIDVETAGVDDVTAAAGASVSVSGGTIYVNAAEGTPVSVYNMSGVCIGNGEGSCSFGPVSVSGIYVVRAGNEVFKVAVR